MRGGGSAQLGMSLVVRTRHDPLALLPALREQVRALDPLLPVSDVRTYRQITAAALAQPRFTTALLVVFAGLALLLAALGLYGVISFVAGRRTNEMGIRMALGARRSEIARLVVGEGLALALVGIGSGVLGALWLTRYLTGMLYGVRAADPLTFVAVPAVLLVVAAIAAYLPARRAARVSPVSALRIE
jgi:ABC-type lipoprotein release transport system permease subunit